MPDESNDPQELKAENTNQPDGADYEEGFEQAYRVHTSLSVDPEQLDQQGLERQDTESRFVVKFDEPTDDRNPQQWTYKKKWLLTLLTSCLTFISPVSSSIVAPAAASVSKELGISNTYVSSMVVSIFVLGYAIGPLFLSPLSEMYGRRPVMLLSNMVYLVFNLGCGFAQTPVQLIVCRLFAGIGGSVPQSVGSGTLSDIWSSEERGKAYSIYTTAPMLGPCLGPIAGGFIAQETTWRWAFWSTTIADAFIAVVIYFYMQETYAPQILRRMAVSKRKESGDNRFHSLYDETATNFGELLTKNLVRPLKFLCTQPIIQFVSIYMAFLYGVFYLLLTTFPSLWSDKYHQSVGIGGLHYISITFGSIFAAQTSSRLLDMIYRRLKDDNEGTGLPEFRAPMMMVASVIFPSGMFIYGWTAEYQVHWIGPDIGMAIASMGILFCFAPLQIYVVDSFGRYAASAMAAVVLLRSLCGFALPLAGPKMYQELGYGWGNSVLGFISLGLGIPLPFILWFKGEKLRLMSKYAMSSVRVKKQDKEAQPDAQQEAS